MIARGRADAQARFVSLVNGLAPRPRRQAAHAERHHVAPLLDGVLEGPRERAGAKQHHAVGNANRDDLGVGSAAENRVAMSRGAAAGQDAQGSGAVPRVVEHQHAIVRVLGAPGIGVALHEVALEVPANVGRHGVVSAVVAGVDVSDTRARLCEGDRRAGRGQLRMAGVEMPPEGIRAGHLSMESVLRDRPARLANSKGPAGRGLVGVTVDVVHEIGLGKDHVGFRHAEPGGDLRVRQIPGGRCSFRKLRHEPLRRGRGAEVSAGLRFVKRPKVGTGLDGAQGSVRTKFDQDTARWGRHIRSLVLAGTPLGHRLRFDGRERGAGCSITCCQARSIAARTLALSAASRRTVVHPCLPQAPLAGENTLGWSRMNSCCSSGASFTMPHVSPGPSVEKILPFARKSGWPM